MRADLLPLEHGGPLRQWQGGQAPRRLLADLGDLAGLVGRALSEPDLTWAEPTVAPPGLQLPLLTAAADVSAGQSGAPAQRAAGRQSTGDIRAVDNRAVDTPSRVPANFVTTPAAGGAVARGAAVLPPGAAGTVPQSLPPDALLPGVLERLAPASVPAPAPARPVGLALLAELAGARAGAPLPAPPAAGRAAVASAPPPAGGAAVAPAAAADEPQLRAAPAVARQPGPGAPHGFAMAPAPAAFPIPTAPPVPVQAPVGEREAEPGPPVQFSVQVAMPPAGAPEAADLEDLSRRIKAILVAEARRHGIEI